MDIETILISTFTVFGISGIIGYFVQNYLTQKRETELRMQQDNRGHYESWMVWMRIVMNPEKLQHFRTEDPMIKKLTNSEDIKKLAKERLVEFYYSAIFFCPDFVLSSMKEFLSNPNEANLMKVAVAMRKDLWKKNTKTTLEMLSIE